MKHAEHSPSKFPQYEKCLCFESAPVGAAAKQGSYEHEVLENFMKGRTIGDVDDATIDKVQWAYETVLSDVTRLKVQATEVQIEQRVGITDENFEEVTFGTLDISFRDYLYDYKSGQMRNYWGQMAVYALGMMQAKNLKKVNVVILYGRFKKRDEYVIELAEAEEYVFGLITALKGGDLVPKKNDYCGWCQKKTSCPEIIGPVKAVLKKLDIPDISPRRLRDLLSKSRDKLKPGMISELMPVAEAVQSWADAIIGKCREYLDAEQDVPGWKLQSKNGAKFINDVSKARELLGIDAENFINACTVSLPKLSKLYRSYDAELKSDAAARIAVESKIETVLAQKKASISMVKDDAKN